MTPSSPESDSGLTSRQALEALVVDDPDLEQLETLLGQFNIFEALGAVRVEHRHSAFLAFLLDPQANHGLGDAFPRRLFERVLQDQHDRSGMVSPIDMDVWDMNGATVRREWQNIDIIFEDAPHKFIAVIENKISSGEHSDQLKRYLNTIARHYPGWKVLPIFLTPEGEAPSEDAFFSADYNRVLAIVDELRETRSSTLGPDVRTLMGHYTEMLRRHIVSESEVADLCRRIYRKHRQALDLILEYRPDQQASIAEHLTDLIRQTPGLELDQYQAGKTYIRFLPATWDLPGLRQGSGWTKSGRLLLYEFANTTDYLRLKLTIGPGNEETRQRLFSLASSPPLKPAFKELGKSWATIFTLTFLNRKDYEDSEPGQIEAKIDTTWQHFLQHEHPKIREIIEAENWG
jgi:hypothetical protein